jgi:hypothetical protein
MKYVIVTIDLGKPLYYCLHEEQNGFTLSSDISKAQLYSSKKEADIQAQRLSEVSGMKTEVRLK